jgi:hypothetical protein
MTGNVGIGTWKPTQLLTVGVNAFTASSGGSLAASSLTLTSSMSGREFTYTGGANITTNNVGIGTTLASAKWVLGNTATTGTVNEDMVGFYVNPNFTEAASGNHTWIANTYLAPGTITGAAATVGSAANLYVGNAPTGTFSGNTYAIYSAAGNNTFLGNVGVGSITPGSQLDIAGNTRVTASGHITSTGTAPTVANNDCGTTVQGTVTAKSTDNSGSLTAGTLAVTSCAMTFANAWVNAPNCVVIDDTNILAVKSSTSTTKLTVTSTTSMSGDVLSYICQGNE